MEMPLPAKPEYQRDLGNGLIVRWSTSNDTEKIAQLVSHTFRIKANDPPNKSVAEKVRRLMRGDNPLTGPGDFCVIEDASREEKPIIACGGFQRQEWEYEGILLPVGRPEIGAIHPDYRNRKLSRVVLDIVHARSHGEGHLLQAIAGIPYFYRQFGYEYALDLEGRRVAYLSRIPKTENNEPERYTLRSASLSDIPLITQFYNLRRSASIVRTKVSERYWRYVIEEGENNPDGENMAHLLMIVDVHSVEHGFLFVSSKPWEHDLGIFALEVTPEVDLAAAIPSILRALRNYGKQSAFTHSHPRAFSRISFYFGRSHPVYDALGQDVAPFYDPPYSWYIRVPDLPALLERITPSLEGRLANSELASYTGELRLNCYYSGLHMVFKQGRMTTVEHYDVPIYDTSVDAGCPALILLPLVFGHRSLDELRYAYPEVWANSEAALLLKTLFPAKPSWVLPL